MYMLCLIHYNKKFIKNVIVIFLKRHLRPNVHNGFTALLMIQCRPEICLSHTHYNNILMI